jgi:hypothetical protein
MPDPGWTCIVPAMSTKDVSLRPRTVLAVFALSKDEGLRTNYCGMTLGSAALGVDWDGLLISEVG